MNYRGYFLSPFQEDDYLKILVALNSVENARLRKARMIAQDIDDVKNWLDFYRKVQGRKSYIFAIRNLTEYQIEGFVLLKLNSLKIDEAEVGIYIFNTERSGIGTCALSLIENLAKDHLKIVQIRANVAKSNLRAVHFFKKNGYSISNTGFIERIFVKIFRLEKLIT